MAKGKSKGRRDLSTSVSNGTLSVPRVTPSSVDLAQVQDRRLYHPEAAHRPPLSLSGGRTRLKAAAPLPSKKQAPSRVRTIQAQVVPVGVAFRDPTGVLVCVRRKIRKEVLHALNKTGYGKKRRRPRRSRYSGIRC